MDKRKLKPGLVVTASALVACSGVVDTDPLGGIGLGGDDGPTRNPPPLPPSVPTTMPSGPVTDGQVLNPRDPDGRPVFVSGDRCWVEVPFDEPPTAVVPPPTKAIACPPVLVADPAWAACAAGTVSVKTLDPLTCECFWFGNPPPAPKTVACPEETVARAGTK